MKNLLFFISFAMMLFSCGKKTQDTSANTNSPKVNKVVTQSSDSDDEDDYDDDDDDDDGGDADNNLSVNDVVNNIYNDIADGSTPTDIIEEYGSSDLRRCWKACPKARNGISSEFGFIDGMDVFTNSTDNRGLKWTIESVNMKRNGSAVVSLLVESSGGCSGQTLSLIKEGGWVVDDVISPDCDGVEYRLKRDRLKKS